MLLNIIIGLIGLGFVVFIHELGHFIAARLAGIEVESFSIGWGKKLTSFERNGVEYRISMLPIGGYCKMKGEDAMREAMQNDAERIEPEPGSFYAASPVKRIGVAFSGPFFNIVFSILLMSVVWMIGFTIQTYENRIILMSDYNLNEEDVFTPAEEAGLQTGDYIVEIDGNDTETYRDIREIVAVHPGDALDFTVLRNGETLNYTLTPELNPQTGAGMIGVYAWIPPVIADVQEERAAAIAGLEEGDRIVSANGRDIPHAIALEEVIRNRPDVLSLEILRNGEVRDAELLLSYNEDGLPDLGIQFDALETHTPRVNPIEAVGKGFTETFDTLFLVIKSLGLLFQGVDLGSAVQGPIRITYFLGEVTTQSLGLGIGQGITAFLSFIALLSTALGFMNLLPIPVLDGGLILLFIIELVKGSQIKPKHLYRYQFIGVILVFGLLIFAIVGDIAFLFQQ
ncbi:MAG: site-2 protease family protein [Spirochaetia bacterium]